MFGHLPADHRDTRQCLPLKPLHEGDGLWCDLKAIKVALYHRNLARQKLVHLRLGIGVESTRDTHRVVCARIVMANICDAYVLVPARLRTIAEVKCWSPVQN